MDPRVAEIAVRLGPGAGVRAGPGPAPLRRVRGTGIPGLDRLLPGGGYPEGALVELVGLPDGGRGLLAMAAAAHHSRRGRVAWATAEGTPDPWLLRAMGGQLRSFSLVRLRRRERYAWAVEQVLRSGLFRLVVAQGTGPVSGRVLFGPAAWRRWAAAAAGGDSTLLLLLEDLPRVAELPRPASLRLRVEGCGDGGTRVRVERAAGHAPGARG
ncbi:MAG: hypothetical protein FJ098_12725, partial [Deltaproteobacteria bacterium]|nr:hypothetical protein [Deltaproteobacteria bacterium]